MIYQFKGEHRYLSNFYVAPITYRSEVYQTNEALFQALKTFKLWERETIRLATSPQAAKKLGRQATLRYDWELVKDDIMLCVVKLKFLTHKVLRDKLVKEDRYLIEGNWWHDTYWGVCDCPKHKGTGLNKLGCTHMKTRQWLITNGF